MTGMEVPHWNVTKKQVSYWVSFIGVTRLIIGLLATTIASAGIWLLVRPSAPLVESVVPHASGVGTVMPLSTLPTPLTVRIHVAGAVVRPGVYTVSSSARVVDAVTAAGGATSRADLERINLAQTIVDTEQVFVPFRSTHTTKVTVAPRLRPSRTTIPVSVPAIPGAVPIIGAPITTLSPLINLNSATSDQLDTLPGVGPSTAKAIISYRTRKGPFGKVEDLLNVPGIGPAKVEAIRDQVTV
jgi:competence protein ComEA